MESLVDEVVLRDVIPNDLPITFKFEHEPEGYRMAAFSSPDQRGVHGSLGEDHEGSEEYSEDGVG